MKGKDDQADTSVEVALDEETVAQLDELIELHSTPTRRLSREEMLNILLEKAREMAARGEPLLPHLAPTAEEDDEAAGSSTPPPGDKDTH